MADYSSTTQKLSPPYPNTITPVAPAGAFAGAALTPSADDEVVGGKADSASTTRVSGLARFAAAPGGRPLVQFAGVLELAADQWDVVAGTTGGLVAGTPYYLSPTTAGKLTSTAPFSNGHFRAQVGVAQSDTELLIQITEPDGPLT